MSSAVRLEIAFHEMACNDFVGKWDATLTSMEACMQNETASPATNADGHDLAYS